MTKLKTFDFEKNLVIVRGGGDISTGTITKLYKSGFSVLVLETNKPSAIRRNVAFSEAIYQGQQRVEDVTCFLAHNINEAKIFLKEGKLAILVDPSADAVAQLKPLALVDVSQEVSLKQSFVCPRTNRYVKGEYKTMNLTYPNNTVELIPETSETLFQRALISLMKNDLDVNLIKEEWFASKPMLFICGGGHVSKELADIAVKLDFRVNIMDDRAEFACRERFPDVNEIICDSFERLENYLVENSFYVVVTRGHQDDYVCVI